MSKSSCRRIAPKPDLLESPSPALLLHARVVNSLRNSYWVVLIFRSGKSTPPPPPFFFFFFFFNQQCKARDVENSKLTWQNHVRFQVKVESKMAAIAAPKDPFTFEIFLSPPGRLCCEYDVSRWVNLNFWNNLQSSMVRGTASVRTSVLSSVAASVESGPPFLYGA